VGAIYQNNNLTYHAHHSHGRADCYADVRRYTLWPECASGSFAGCVIVG